MSALTDLQVAVTANTTAVQAATAAIYTLTAEGNPTTLGALAKAVTDSNAALNAAVAAAGLPAAPAA